MSETRASGSIALPAGVDEYAERSWQIFPVHWAVEGRCICGDVDCDSPAKHPLTTHGFLDASADLAQIAAWWLRWPAANVGLACGAVSGIVTIDIDVPKNGAANGLATWKALEEEHGRVVTLEALTPSGGRHLDFAHPGVPVKTGRDLLGPGVDIRGDGGYVLVPPSVGVNGRAYKWMNRKPLAPLPKWVLAALHEEPQLELPDELPENHRHKNLVSLAGSMRRRGLDAQEMLPTLLEVNERRGVPPKPRAAVVKIAEDIGKRYRPVGDLIDFPLTDLGNARRFTAMHEGAFLHAREERRWLEWRDGRWRRDVTGAAERAAKAVVEALWEQVSALPAEKRSVEGKPTPLVKWAIASQSSQKLRAMLELASTEPAMVVRLEELDADPWLLSVANGTLDLRDGSLREPDPADLISLGTDVAYVPDAPRPRWEQFQGEVFADDLELMAYVKRAYGSFLTGDTRDRALFIEQGSRFNGKSTMNGAFQYVLGHDLAHTAPVRVVMRARQSEIPNEIAALHRKRFVVVAETADGRRLDEPRVKALTGNDRVPARALYREWFEFVPEYKIVLYTNHRPRVDASDGAIWDRIRLIPFTVSFADREDRELGDKLREEAEGILAWAVEGCLEWADDGLGSCDVVDRATDEYRAENDLLAAFVDECCEIESGASTSKKAMRAACRDYFKEQGEDAPTAWALTNALLDRGVRQSRQRYRGIRLLEESL